LYPQYFEKSPKHFNMLMALLF